jgi:hypothetical protein
MTEESDFWRGVRSMIQEEIANSRRPTGVTPSTRDGNTVDRYGQVVYIEQRRGAGLTLTTGPSLVASAGPVRLASGTVTFGTANVQWNDGSAFWGTAQPTRLTVPVAGRYLVTGHLQAAVGAGTADITAGIGISNGMTWPIYDSQRIAVPSGVFSADLDTYNGVYASIVNMRANDYAHLEIGAVFSTAATVTTANIYFAIERIG